MKEPFQILLAHETMEAPGGGTAVAAYALQALAENYHVSLACMSPPDCEWLNSFFGTQLNPEQYRTHLVPRAVQRSIRLCPTPHGLLRHSVLERYVRHLAARHHFDAFLSTNNEFAFPVPGIQYVHYPRTSLERPDVDYRWYHGIPGALKLYRDFCRRVSGSTIESLRENVTITNSSYTGDVWKRVSGTRPHVIFPPVPMSPDHPPWNSRQDQIVCLGRISPEKDIPKLVDVVQGLRRRGHNLRLILIGAWDCDPAYAARIRTLLRSNSAWLQHHEGLDRNRLTDVLANSRYGIHGMVGEHFGMAVAEMLRAGCIAFVPNVGGPVEIVGGRRELIYSSREDAVEKITTVLERPDLQIELHDFAAARGAMFSARRFMTEIQSAVATVLKSAPKT